MHNFIRIAKPKRGPSRVGEIAGCKHNMGYVVIGVDGCSYLAHRLAWLYVNGEWPKFIDHRNHNRTDNRISNLGSVTRLENQRNMRLSASNTSGVTGVNWGENRWNAHITINFKKKHLGSFIVFKDAVKARKIAEKKYGFHENHGMRADNDDQLGAGEWGDE